MNSIKIIYIYRQRILGKVHIKILPVIINQVTGLWEMLIINILSFVLFSIINRPCCLIKKHKTINYFIFWKTTKIQSQSKPSSRILGLSHSSQDVGGICFAFHTPHFAWACWVGTCEIPSQTYLDWPLPMWVSHSFLLYFSCFFLNTWHHVNSIWVGSTICTVVCPRWIKFVPPLELEMQSFPSACLKINVHAAVNKSISKIKCNANKCISVTGWGLFQRVLPVRCSGSSILWLADTSISLSLPHGRIALYSVLPSPAL